MTPGFKAKSLLEQEAQPPRIPKSLEGKTVLDIGAWDGYFSFEAERRGASRVVALDHYVWSLDLSAQHAYWKECKTKGIPVEPYHSRPELWKPETLIGKAGFDTAKSVLQSKVEPLVGDFMNMDTGDIGVFDITFYLGVLYHVESPMYALRKLAAVTRELAIIETAVFRSSDTVSPVCRFFESDEFNSDPSNWWAPNCECLMAMCRAAGFNEVSIVDDTAAPPAPTVPGAETFGRVTLHASHLS